MQVAEGCGGRIPLGPRLVLRAHGVEADQEGMSVERFAQHYRGRHSPEDALWWSSRPDEPGPSSAEPPGAVLAELVTALRGTCVPDLADRLEALGDLLLAADAQHLANAVARTAPR